MNLFKAHDLLKNFSDDQLDQQMRSPSGEVPPFLVMAELDRRSEMRKEFSGQAPQTSVLDDVLNQTPSLPDSTFPSGMPKAPTPMNGGLPTIPQGQAPQNAGIPPVNFAQGGPVGYANGGGIPWDMLNSRHPAQIGRQTTGGAGGFLDQYLDPKATPRWQYYPAKAAQGLGSAASGLGSILYDSPLNMPRNVQKANRAVSEALNFAQTPPAQTTIRAQADTPSGIATLPPLPGRHPDAFREPPISDPQGPTSIIPTPAPTATDYFTQALSELKGISSDRGDASLEYDRIIQDMTNRNEEMMERDKGIALASLGFNIAAGTNSNALTNISRGAAASLPSFKSVTASQREFSKSLVNAQERRAAAREAYRSGKFNDAINIYRVGLEEQRVKLQGEALKAKLKASGAGSKTVDNAVKNYTSLMKAKTDLRSALNDISENISLAPEEKQRQSTKILAEMKGIDELLRQFNFMAQPTNLAAGAAQALK